MKIAVLSDIHGNQYALKQVLREAAQNKVEKILLLGDIVGYYYQPLKVLQLLQSWDCEFIRGNHENLLKELRDSKIDTAILQKKYGSGHQVALEQLSEAQVQELVTLPQQKKIVLDSTTLLMCHGSNWDADYYLYPDAALEILNKCDEPGVDFVLIGHSHYQFAYRTKSGILINAGSVGQSRTKGGIANWAIINTVNKSFELRSSLYDVQPLLVEVDKMDPGLTYLKEILKRNNS